MEDQILWEYRVRNLGTAWKTAKADDIEAELSLWGEEGWEVISCAYNPYSSLTVIAKRPLTETERRRRSRSNAYS